MSEPITGKRGRGRPPRSVSPSQSSSNDPIINPDEESKFAFAQPEGNSSFSPLADSPIQRDYSAPKINEGDTPALEEPTFHQPSFEEIKNAQNVATPQSGGSTSSGQNVGQAPSVLDNPNPAINQLDDKEKAAAAEQMVESVLDTYETVCTLGSKLGQVKESEVIEAMDEGRINRNRRIPVDERGSTVSVLEFVQGYNEQVAEAVAPDPDFRKKVKPPMVRVFAKRGWGMTDEQFLIFAFGKDISMKAVTLFSMKKGIKDILTKLEEEQIGTGGSRQASPPPPPPPPPSYPSGTDHFSPPPPPPPSPSPSPQPSIPDGGGYEDKNFWKEEKDEVIVPPQEDLTDEDLRHFKRMEDLGRTISETDMAEGQQDSLAVSKMAIRFEDNPLRDNVSHTPPPPIVEEHFQKGAEVTDFPPQS